MEDHRVPWSTRAFAPWSARDASTSTPPPADVNHAIDTILASIQTQEKSTGPHSVSEASQTARTDRALDELAMVLKSFEDELKHRMALLCKQRNALAPVNRLPVELFAEIIDLSLTRDETPIPDAAVHRLVLLSAVSSRWWYILASTPSLWRWLEPTSPCTHLAIRRSQHCPLEIKVIDSLDRSFDDSSEFFEAIVAQSHRWKTLLWCTPETSHLEVALMSPLPLLETLEMNAVFNTSSYLSALSVDFTSLPKLRNLSLAAFIIPLTTAHMPSLTCLSLKTILPTPLLPSIPELLQICTTFPCLEELRMKDLYFEQEHSLIPLPLELHHIHLPRLKVLTLHEVFNSVLVYTLLAVRADNLEVLNFGDDTDFQIKPFLDVMKLQPSSPSLILAALNSGSTKSDPISICVGLESVEIRYGETGFIHLPGSDTLDDMEDIVNALHLDNLAHPVKLTIDFEATCSNPPEMSSSFLCQLPTLTLLQMDIASPEQIVSILDRLSTSPKNDDWPCPNLKEVYVASYYGDGAMHLEEEMWIGISEALRKLIRCRGELRIRDHQGQLYREDIRYFMEREMVEKDG